MVNSKQLQLDAEALQSRLRDLRQQMDREQATRREKLEQSRGKSLWRTSQQAGKPGPLTTRLDSEPGVPSETSHSRRDDAASAVRDVARHTHQHPEPPSLLSGKFDEHESHSSFLAALESWRAAAGNRARKGAAGRAQSTREVQCGAADQDLHGQHASPRQPQLSLLQRALCRTGSHAAGARASLSTPCKARADASVQDVPALDERCPPTFDTNAKNAEPELLTVRPPVAQSSTTPQALSLATVLATERPRLQPPGSPGLVRRSPGDIKILSITTVLMRGQT